MIERRPLCTLCPVAVREYEEHAWKLDEEQRQVARRYASKDIDPNLPLSLDVGDHQVMVPHRDARVVEGQHLSLGHRHQAEDEAENERFFHAAKAITWNSDFESFP